MSTINTIPETISVLEEFNKWRRGDETIPQPEPFEIGVAIGDAVQLLRELETELAAERAIVSKIWVQLGSPTYAELNGRSIYDLIDEIKTDRAEVEKWQSVAATMSAEREHNANEAGRLRAELAVSENWVEHYSKHADDLIGENVKLRAEVERVAVIPLDDVEGMVIKAAGAYWAGEKTGAIVTRGDAMRRALSAIGIPCAKRKASK